jgi:RNA polymerase sigma factor (sigma-70 family)
MLLKNKKILSDDQKKALWERYRKGDDEKVFSEMLEAYVPLVEIVAHRQKGSMPDTVEIGDLISEGMFGLAKAIEKFDDSDGNKFETYATFRIRGAIFDALRTLILFHVITDRSLNNLMRQSTNFLRFIKDILQMKRSQRSWIGISKRFGVCSQTI